ncbi:hypothetical protein GHT06_001884 [Daphnia sinensis]|uniref:Uncharacterized protein n=1 Tax=Daphnia sinensis TaxID=1820382 RepID=A0AAD5KDQ9_9CRUS|nr:hypothetical protein GHT06_001884 [Daphnia sinensis]
MLFKNQKWTLAQQKNTVNQPPMFDVFDSNGISFGDTSYYRLSTFNGSKLFSYALSESAAADSVLGLPIKYSGAAVLGDIAFQSFYNTDQFEYNGTTKNIAMHVNSGYVHENVNGDILELNGWVKSSLPPVQYQIFENVSATLPDFSPDSMFYICDVPARINGRKTLVYHDNVLLSDSQYSVSISSNRTTVSITDRSLSTSAPVTIMVDSAKKSNIAYYELPIQLQINPINDSIGQLNMGEVRLHYQSIFKNTPTLTGDAYGSNTYRDMGNIESNGDKIIKNSCSFPLMAAMIKNSSSDFMNALDFSADMYAKFKDAIIRLIEQTEFTVYDSSAKILDEVMNQYITAYGMGSEFGLSDMLPCLTPSIDKSYVITTQTTLTAAHIYDFTTSNNAAILLYRTESSTATQMVRGIDYSVDGSVITLLKAESGNTITVREYTNTTGSYIPSTPTKLGLYPSYVPEILLDDTYVEPTWFIKGHDGSLTKTFGEIVNGNPVDFRDKALFEFETRVFNNLKVKSPILQVADIVPGFFRKTDYSFKDVLDFSNSDFMNWAGKHRIDYKTQYFIQSEPKTYNYKISTNKINGDQMVSGSWRGIYLQFYDTATPHITPWEMVGLTTKPAWWDARYGDAPYTNLNSLLWNDMEEESTDQLGINNSHFVLSNIKLDDSINPNGYLTYFMDYYASMGKGYSSYLNALTQNLDTRLSYKIAGFIDSDTISFATNSVTVDGTSDGLLIPQESYSILLHSNEPFDKIKYSSIIVQKTNRGYKIYGNSQNSAYFEYYKAIPSDQNSIPVSLSDMYVYRDGTRFVTTPLKDGVAFSYFKANLSNVEHVVVFDNTSIFGDTLYDPLTGMRQIRIHVNGIKTNNWNGTITTGGFIMNQDNVTEWETNRKYTKGVIVTYKNSYWISNDVLPPAKKFDETKWTKTDYSAIQKGLLPNPNTKSYESDLYYSAYKETLTPDMDQLGRSLIGYRQRPYFENTTVNDISQFNFMRSAAKFRGTNVAVTALSNASINGENVEYKVYENWSIKSSDFGGVMNSNYIDVKLSDKMRVHNPSVIQITGSNDLKNADEYVNVKQLYGYARPPKSQDILPLINTFDYAVPYAGYVNINEVKAQSYNYAALQNGPIPTSVIYRGDYVWIADDVGSWQIYTPVTVTNDSNFIVDSAPFT